MPIVTAHPFYKRLNLCDLKYTIITLPDTSTGARKSTTAERISPQPPIAGTHSFLSRHTRFPLREQSYAMFLSRGCRYREHKDVNDPGGRLLEEKGVSGHSPSPFFDCPLVCYFFAGGGELLAGGRRLSRQGNDEPGTASHFARRCNGTVMGKDERAGHMDFMRHSSLG